MHLPRRWIDRRVYEYLAVNVGIWFYRAPPILVYQMGRVASSSVRNALFRSRSRETRLVLMSHEFYPVRNRNIDRVAADDEQRLAIRKEVAHAQDVFRRLSWRKKIGLLLREKFYSEMIYRNIVARQRAAKVITLVREPIGNNISMFFQVFEQYAGPHRDPGSYAMHELIELFLNSYVHSRPLTWFDVEFKRTLGIDVYEHPFPKETGYLAVKHGNVDLLVLKCELSDSIKERAISRFLGIDDFTITRSNVTARKASAQTYKQFQKAVQLPDSYIDAMYGSKYAQHFYGERELATFRRRWQGAAQTLPQESGESP
jgi:hypothetical protein